MSKIYGKEFDPCMRTNNRIMMRINPEPVVLTIQDIVDDLTYRCFDYSEYQEILGSNKKQMKVMMKDIANYRAYNYEGYELSYHNDDEDWDRYWHEIYAHVMTLFPQFEVKQ
tara:strand:+ start:1081 stop:1416 length:336 start_codon:yes stop_codon:yes gene_type:complete